MQQVRFVLIILAWLVTVFVRFKVKVEPGEMLWFMWVLAQGICAAGIGWQLRGQK
jgi:hypothetical protein